MKRFFHLSFLLLMAMTVVAQTRTATDAQRLADDFWPKSRGGENLKQEMVYTEKDSVNQRPYFYIFNRGNNQGFIIISADERSKKVLAYSDTGSFDTNNVPPELRKWLRVYQVELKGLSLTPDSLIKAAQQGRVLSKGRAKGSQSFATSVKPLLGNINYSQEYPYNAFCPQYGGRNSVTGCVATGAVQIMRYWEYPKTPTGKSHSYVHNGLNIATNFTTTYDWDNMLGTYQNNTGSQREQEAIAQLMYDAGVSCNMMYTPNESAAYTNEMAAALTTYFGYDKGITMFRRDDFTEADFSYFLKRELNAGRPVLFSGAGSGGGHCFVCDGYDNNGYFHINWGWNGTSNGYFHVSNLNPSALGTGGGSGGYNRNVMFFGGIQPPRNNTRVSYVLGFTTMSAPLRLGRGQTGNFVMTMLNNSSLYSFNGQCGVALYSGGKFKQLLGSAQVSLKPNYHYDNFSVRATMPRNLATGNYQVVMVFKEKNDTQWRPCQSATCNCIDMNISSQGTVGKFNNYVHYCDIPDNGFDRIIDDDGIEEVEYEDGNEQTTVMLTHAIAFASGNNISNGNQTINAHMKASGNYSGKVGVFIYDYVQDNCVATLQAKTISLRGGKSSNISFSGIINLSEGNYLAAIFYTDSNGQWKLMGDKTTACVPFVVGEGGIDHDDVAVVEEEEDDDNVSPFADDEEDVMVDEEDETYDDETVDIEEEYFEEEDEDYDWESDEDSDYDFGDEEEDDDGNYGFFDFIDDLFSKGTAQDVSITCKKMQLRDVEPSQRDGHSVYDFQWGQSAKLDFVLNNNQKDDETRILTVSLYDKDDQWVADLAEKLVNVGGKQQKKGTFFLRFSDVQPGAYKLRMTEAMGDDDVCSPVFPAAASSLYVQVKR